MMSRKDVDSGWAWVVLAASYMNLFILSGVCYMGGMFQVLFLEHFQQSVGLTAWVTALFAALMLLSGPLTSVIATYFDCRTCVMTGGVFIACGLVGASYANSLGAMFASFGIIAGLGLGLGYTPSVVVVNFYFEKKRTLVTSLALSASGTGLMVAPLLYQFLMDTFAWRETLLILAAICLHVSLFGALMFPVHERRNKTLRCWKTESEDEPSATLASSQMLNELANYELSYSTETETSTISTDQKFMGIQSEQSVTKKMLRTKECKSARKVNQLDIFKSQAFIVFCFNQFLCNASCGIFNIHLAAFCESYGSTTIQIAWILAVNGPANMVARMLLGAFAHAQKRDVWVLYYGALLTSGILFFLIPLFAKTYVAQVVAVILVGTYFGGSYSLPPVLTIECVGLERLASAFGVTMICSGCGWLVAPPVAGCFVDIFGSYDCSMYLAGITMVTSVLVGLPVPQLIKRREVCLPGEDMSINISSSESHQERESADEKRDTC